MEDRWNWKEWYDLALLHEGEGNAKDALWAAERAWAAGPPPRLRDMVVLLRDRLRKVEGRVEPPTDAEEKKR